MYRPARAPRHSTLHRRWVTAHVANSPAGARLAKARRKKWIDNDFHRSADNKWLNAHGAPERFWLPKHDRFEHHTAEQLQGRARVVGPTVYHLRDAREALADNAAEGINTEFEVKDIRPVSDEVLDAMFAELVANAQAAYGDDWARHLVVKVLSNLGGGLHFALQVCRAAHRHGIPTMLLARLHARFRRFRGHTELTWVRGSAVIR